MKEFNIEKYSSIEIGSLRLPICISIKNIMDDYFYEIPEFEVDKRIIENIGGQDTLIKDETQINTHFFYGKFRDTLRIIKVIRIIYSFIDNENLKLMNIKSLIFSESEFIDICLNMSGIKNKDILDVFYEILSTIRDIKDEFIKRAVESLELKKEFPDIPKGKDDDKYVVPKQYLEYMSYPNAMIRLKPCMEYSGAVYFSENIGKAFEDFSWREKELRKIYDTAKSKIDNFTESVKGYVQKSALNS